MQKIRNKLKHRNWTKRSRKPWHHADQFKRD